MDDLVLQYRFDAKTGECTVPCPFDEADDFASAMVGSWSCRECPDNRMTNDVVVHCSHVKRIMAIYEKLAR